MSASLFYKKVRLILLILIIGMHFCCFAQDGNFYVMQKNDRVVFKKHGELAIVRIGWISNDDLRVFFNGSIWIIFIDGRQKQICVLTQPIPTSHLTPFLQPSGNVSGWSVDMGTINIRQVKIIDGEWSMDTGKSWISIFDQD